MTPTRAGEATVARPGCTILVVEDEEALRRYVARVLESAGYRIITAQDGSAALAQLQHPASPIQLVVSDVFMPNMTGPELATRLAAHPAPPRMLFISGQYAGADLPGPLLAKPFQAEELIGLVQRLLADLPEASLA